MEINYRLRMKIKIWEVLQFKQSVNYTMAITLGNYENFMRTKMMGDAFKDIYAFYNSKKQATNIFKERAVRDLCSVLSYRHIKVQRIYFSKYLENMREKKYRIARARIIFIKIDA